MVVALGVSTGGPQALKRVLPKLPEDLPVPVLVVQHMPPVFTRTLADNLARQCALQVCEASDGQIVEPGWVLIAPGGTQMKIERCNCEIVVRITDDPPEPQLQTVGRLPVPLRGRGFWQERRGSADDRHGR